MQGTAIPYLDMGGASIKMNDDGSFNLLVGATDLGTGSDTVLAQMAAEVLGVPLDDIIIYSCDTDFTPFDKGAYASSTTYISGAAVVNAAEKVARADQSRAAKMLQAGRPKPRSDWRQRKPWAPDGRSVSFAEIALNSLHPRIRIRSWPWHRTCRPNRRRRSRRSSPKSPSTPRPGRSRSTNW